MLLSYLCELNCCGREGRCGQGVWFGVYSREMVVCRRRERLGVAGCWWLLGNLCGPLKPFSTLWRQETEDRAWKEEEEEEEEKEVR